MKKSVLLFLSMLLGILFIYAQTPNQFKYQSILRDATGAILENENASIDIEILQGGDTGPVVFSENHVVTTNEFGLIEFNIGSLLNGIGTIEGIDWSVGAFFVQVSFNGSVIGVKQLMSVPYALYADMADSITMFDYNDLDNLPDLFDGDYNSLTNKPETITPEQIEKVGYLTLTHSINLDSLQASVDSNSVKVSFPGFGTTAGTALEGNTPRWTYSGGNMYHPGKVGANVPESQGFTEEALRVGGGILYEGYPTYFRPGMLFYNPMGEGSFRYYNNNYEEKVLGLGTINFVATDFDTLSCVGTKSNLVIQGSMAVGVDAINGENFGFNTFVLKENNLRIFLDDTDEPESGFPYNDWMLKANDSNNGGDSYFAVSDETAQTTPFKIMAGAGDNAIVIGGNGNVGINLFTPTEKLEVNGNIKAASFIGDGSALTGITGSMGGVSNDDTTRIAADTDQDNAGEIVFNTQETTRMTITNEGKVGIGTTLPAYDLDVAGTGRFDDLVVSGNFEYADIINSLEENEDTVDISLDFDVQNKQIVTFGANSGNVTIEGFQNGLTGQEITLVNLNSEITVDIENDGTGTQKIFLPASTSITLNINESARFICDGTNWYCIGKSN